MDLPVVIGLLSAALLLHVALASFAYMIRLFRRHKIPFACVHDDPELGLVAKPQPDAPRQFGWAEVESLTGNFAPSAVIGEGGFSTVYLARLPPDAVPVALKLHRSSERLHRAFRQELDVLLRLRHPHIVPLLGYCDDREEGVLVFEFVPNGSLHEKLHGDSSSVLPWARRMAIAYQLAQALDYLHDGCNVQIVHGDVKASNVLLDGRLEPKLCDFGSARVGFSAAVLPRAVHPMLGSPGYIDPHYLRTGMVTKKSDVYSFGVLLLELITGTEAFDSAAERMLTAAVGPALRDPENNAGELVDRRLAGEYDAAEAAAAASMAAACIGANPSLRPSTAELVRGMAEKFCNWLKRALRTKVGHVFSAMMMMTEPAANSRRNLFAKRFEVMSSAYPSFNKEDKIVTTGKLPHELGGMESSASLMMNDAGRK
ncbi:putative receptor-like protein kinase [Canna indica]|uniref:non-specific serine/threonine protein kinase n=1 Tax=Canna indica TaxID=4628 RepID=A0AAQ3KQD8_9LILI|nr:putative receptor-like protein kinase [Canna indica]